MPSKITISATINAPIEKVWNYWTDASQVMKWNHASDDWHCPKAMNDLRIGGQFSYTMASKDGKMSFDFEGTYDQVQPGLKIVYTMPDGRSCEVLFEGDHRQTTLTESFDPENENPEEVQRTGWQAILDNFKKLVEAK
jgi:uncharacterized protein YndB with AHSA1/START domain